MNMKPVNFNKEEFYRFLYDSLPIEHFEYVLSLFEKTPTFKHESKADLEYSEYKELIEGIGHG